MSMLDIDGALIQGYIDMALSLETAYENAENTSIPPTDGTDWAAVFIVPALIDFNSLGVNGTDLHEGFMQIDFNTKHGTGRATLLGYAQACRDEFVGGKGYTKNAQNVRITNTERSPIRTADGWTRLSVTVNWEAETIRPTI
jgi:hypothetical protein